MKITLKSPKKHRREGDSHRDAGDWAAAVQSYRLHLLEAPQDQPIYVQLGHALRESGKPIEALGAYAAAVALDESDTDAARFMANMLKTLGHVSEAKSVYGNALSLSGDGIADDPGEGDDYYQELQNQEIITPATFFSLQDLFGYLKAHPTMSGIQRVQAGITQHAIGDDQLNAYFILNNNDEISVQLGDGEYWLIDNRKLLKVIQYASGGDVSHEVLRMMLQDCERQAVIVKPGNGSTIILLGAFWGAGNAVSAFIPAHERGVTIGAYIYDIIPVSHPELCDDALVRDFAMSLCELCAIVDFALTISDATGDALRQFVAQHQGRDFPIATVRLAHSMTGADQSTPELPAALKALKSKPFVSYISTIEARKNHIYVVQAWQKLIADGVDVPDLVFVGRYGWKVDPLFELLKNTKNLNGRVHVLHGLSDPELNAVYECSQFTVFTSVVEGWGLPVGESLCHGTPCIASNSSSIPEVGGDFVDYIDVLNFRQGVETFRRMIVDRNYRQQRKDNIRDNFTAIGWSDVSSNFIATLKRLETEVGAKTKIRLNEGEIHRVGNYEIGAGLDSYFKAPTRLLLANDAFYAAENFGAWMVGANSYLNIPTAIEGGTVVVLYIMLATTPWSAGCELTIMDAAQADRALERVDLGRQIGTVRTKVIVSDDGKIKLKFKIDGSFSSPENDSRNFAAGLVLFAFSKEDNYRARQEITETLTFVR